jgi:hypothetical protein
VSVEGSAVRDSLPGQNGQYGRALDAVPGGPAKNDLTVRSSLIERASDVGIIAGKSVLLLEGVAVRDTVPAPGVPSSPGVGVAAHRSDVTIRGTTVERAHAAGIELVGSNATMEQLTVKDTLALPQANSSSAYKGISVIEDNATGTPSVLTLRQAALSGSPHAAISLLRSSALIESALVQGNMLDLDSPKGAAVLVDRADATVRHRVIAGNALAGLGVTGGQAVFESSLIEDMKLDLGSGTCAFAIAFAGEPPAALTLRSSLLRDCSTVGALAFQAALVIETSVIRDVVPDMLGYGGDAVSVINDESADGSLVLTGTLIEAPARAGVSSFGGRVDHGYSAITCAQHGLVGEAGGPAPFTFNELGATLCGCPDAAEACGVESPGLEPPIE